jgi:N-methylhydantoinase A/oxoprolinase/acetone carboxylase beta subunit
MDGPEIVAFHKTPTTPDVSDGIVTAISHLLDGQCRRGVGGTIARILHLKRICRNEIAAVMIGTTHFTNAFVERRRLLKVGVIRIALPAARGVPPMMDWPADFAEAVGRHVYLVRGGYQYDGQLNAELDEKAVAAAAHDMKAKKLRSAAICGLFSPLNSDMEQRAAAIFGQEAPDIGVTLSSEVGRIGLIERENAAIMNASLASLAVEVSQAFVTALTRLGIRAPLFISQNDGTLMNIERLAKFPVLTFASGPTNSMRGAAYLSKFENALVADIGGTTTDVGMLKNGFPRESSVVSDIGGVRTNFRMPDLLSIGLGGGSVIDVGDSGEVRIGPQSVGHRIARDARVFGGDVLTASDIAVAAGYAQMGDKRRVANLDPVIVDAAVSEIHRLFAECVDRMKTNSDPIPLVLVGGGSVLINRPISGISEIIVPDAAAVANAVGASIAQIGGEVDRVFFYDRLGRSDALAAATSEAEREASEAGADPTTLRVVEVEEIPLAYMSGGAVRLRVKVVGDLALIANKGRRCA